MLTDFRYILNKDSSHYFEEIEKDEFGLILKCKSCCVRGKIFKNPVDRNTKIDVIYIDGNYLNFKCVEIIIKNIIE